MEITGLKQKQCWDDKQWPPTEEVVDGLWSVPVPMPGNPVRYILSYVFETADGPVVVDPGWPDEGSWSALEVGLGHAGYSVKDAHGVLMTHYHADHYGLASRLRDASGCWIAMHVADSDMGIRLTDPDAAENEHAWQLDCGVPDTADLSLGTENSLVRSSGRHRPDRPLAAGEDLDIPGWRIQAVWTPGHTPGHMCFLLPDLGIILTGDHVLPAMNPSAALTVFSDGDPLGDYFESLRIVAELGDIEALPGHQYRFRGLPERTEELRQRHEVRNAEVLQALDAGGAASAWELANRVTWSRPLDQSAPLQRRFALGETMSHLRHLEVGGLAERIISDRRGEEDEELCGMTLWSSTA